MDKDLVLEHIAEGKACIRKAIGRFEDWPVKDPEIRRLLCAIEFAMDTVRGTSWLLDSIDEIVTHSNPAVSQMRLWAREMATTLALMGCGVVSNVDCDDSKPEVEVALRKDLDDAGVVFPHAPSHQARILEKNHGK